MYQTWKVTNNAQKMSFPWTINISKNCRANQGHKIGNIQGSDISDFWGRRVCQGGRGRQTILGRPPPYFCASGANWRRPWAWRRFEYFGLPSPNLLSARMVGRSPCYRSIIRLLTKLWADRGKPPPPFFSLDWLISRRDRYLCCKYELLPV